MAPKGVGVWTGDGFVALEYIDVAPVYTCPCHWDSVTAPTENIRYLHYEYQFVNVFNTLNPE